MASNYKNTWTSFRVVLNGISSTWFHLLCLHKVEHLSSGIYKPGAQGNLTFTSVFFPALFSKVTLIISVLLLTQHYQWHNIPVVHGIVSVATTTSVITTQSVSDWWDAWQKSEESCHVASVSWLTFFHTILNEAIHTHFQVNIQMADSVCMHAWVISPSNGCGHCVPINANRCWLQIIGKMELGLVP